MLSDAQALDHEWHTARHGVMQSCPTRAGFDGCGSRPVKSGVPHIPYHTLSKQSIIIKFLSQYRARALITQSTVGCELMIQRQTVSRTITSGTEITYTFDALPWTWHCCTAEWKTEMVDGGP
eukprot:991620-Rhodomonas_salina.1